MTNITNTSNGSTTKWREKLIKIADNELLNNNTPLMYYKDRKINKSNVGIHLAVFTEPFLTLLLTGEKSMESRFSSNKVPPFERVNKGDIVFLKKSGGEVFGYFIAGRANYYSAPSESKLARIKENFSRAIASHFVNDFWKIRERAKYISLINVDLVIELEPFKIDKKDRTAWSTLKVGSCLNIRKA